MVVEAASSTAKMSSMNMFNLEGLVSWNMQDGEESSTVSWQWCDSGRSSQADLTKDWAQQVTFSMSK